MVEEIVMVTPPGPNGKVAPNTLVAAREAGADVIYKVGGATGSRRACVWNGEYSKGR